jgi:hypothetical protein
VRSRGGPKMPESTLILLKIRIPDDLPGKYYEKSKYLNEVIITEIILFNF